MTDQNHDFRIVMRGYEPREVDGVLTRLREELGRAQAIANENAHAAANLQAQLAQLGQHAEEQRARIAHLEAEAAPLKAEDLGPRISQMLRLAEEEAADITGRASSQAAQVVAETEAGARQRIAEADRYHQDVTGRADADAARIVQAASRQADEILDHADREAAARREEAETVYEQQLARAAAAAADFEKTLAERRDRAAAEFTAQMQANEQALARAQELQAVTEAEASRLIADAQAEAQATLKAAQAEASHQVETARATADKIRRDSERELRATTARRDAITAQLANVRQMLATLGGAALAGGPLLGAPAEPIEVEGDLYPAETELEVVGHDQPELGVR